MKNKFERTLNLILWNSQLIFHMFWRSHFIFAHENHWVAWSLRILKYFQMKFKYFQQPFSFNLNGRSNVIFSLGFCIWKEFEFREIKMQNESLGKSFYSLSFNFQKVSNFTQFQSINHTTIKQSIKSIYLL